MNLLIRACMVLVLSAAAAEILPAQKSRVQQKKTDSKALASVDGVTITEKQARDYVADDLFELELQDLRSRAQAARNERQLLQRAVDSIIEDRLLQAEASKRGVSLEELISTEIDQKVPETTSEEIDLFYQVNRDRIRGSKEQLSTQIGNYIKEQKEKTVRAALVSRLEGEHKVTRNIEPFRAVVQPEGRPSLGPSSAPVTLILFSDFQCPYCKSFSATLHEIVRRYGEKVRLVFRQYPLNDIHPDAQRAAEASLCANRQGKFWEMHDLLFEDQENLREESLKAKAGQLGLDQTAFASCLAAGRHAADVIADLRAAASAGVEGTPSVLVNGRYLHGNVPFEQIAAVIDDELKRKK